MKLKLWLLQPVKGLLEGDNPWEPWYDKVFGFVVQAKSEVQAREMAQAEAGDEKLHDDVWKNAKYSSCIVLSVNGDAKIILKDTRFA